MLALVPLDLVVPELLHPDSDLRLPALERWLARGDAATLPQGDVSSVAAHAYGLASPVPVGAISLATSATAPEGTWLRADPVHLEVMQDAVALRDGAVLDVTRAEADAIVRDLAAHFAADGFTFHAPTPGHWMVRVPDGEAPVTVPMAQAEGRNLFGLLPRGQGKVNWPSALTEVQMLLATHPVNAEREARRQLAINAVWFWGEGVAPAVLPRPYALVCSDDPFVRGLGHLSGARVMPEPKSWNDIDAVRADESVLVVVAAPARAWRRGDASAFEAAAKALDAAWFTSMRDGLDRFEAVTLTLPRGRDSLVARLRPGMRWRLFRGVKPLATRA